MVELHKALTKTLTENGIIDSEMSDNRQKIAKIIDSITTVQNDIL